MLAGWAASRGVRLAGFTAGFESGDVLGTGERQQVAQLGGVDETGRMDREGVPGLEALDAHGTHPVAVGIGCYGRVAQQNGDAAGAHVGRQHLLQYGERDARLVGEAGDRAIAGIQVPARPGVRGKRVVAPVECANAVPKFPIQAGAAEGLDPGILIGRDGLGGELAADPIGFLGNDDAHAIAGGSQGRGAPAGSAADDGHIATEFAGGPQMRGQCQRAAEPANQFPP